ncbi:MAG: hypothetical protein ABUL61_04960, partial [Oleiharenicola lentus]
MTLPTSLPAWLRAFSFCFVALLLAGSPAFAADAEMIVSTTPMKIEAEGQGAHGQLVVAPEIVSTDATGDLVFTITVEPEHGRVGLAGGEDE